VTADTAEDRRIRCSWARTSLSIAYHDVEWGVPVHDDKVLFEFLILEGAQAGLSWETILAKRPAYRECFAGFDPAAVARFTPARIERLLQNPGLVRNRLKITSTVTNAKAFLRVQSEFGSFDSYVAICRRNTSCEPLARTSAHTGAVSRVEPTEPRPVETRLQVRGIDYLLCLHASGRLGERSHRRLFSVPSLQIGLGSTPRNTRGSGIGVNTAIRSEAGSLHSERPWIGREARRRLASPGPDEKRSDYGFIPRMPLSPFSFKRSCQPGAPNSCAITDSIPRPSS
jgi:DNA-3-methyladenine glycosylase I